MVFNNTKEHNKIIKAGIIGNVIEWYDFAVYGYLALTIGHLFFPSFSTSASILASFGTFAIGFLMRPLGSLLFGYIGDKIGRREALILSIFMMAIPTFLIGALPTYEQIGVFAPILLVILRMLQGLSVGGEYTTSLIFLAENSPSNKRGFMTIWGLWGATAGILLGSAIAALISSLLSPEQLLSWGWRLPFLSGIILAIFGFYMRSHLCPHDCLPDSQKSQSPIKDTIIYEWRNLLKIAGLSMVDAVGFYVIFVYLVTWLQINAGILAKDALMINSINILMMLIILPFCGALSDKIGRKSLLISSILALIILTYPLFLMMMFGGSLLLIWLAQFIFVVLISLFMGAFNVAIIEIVPHKVRVTAVSLSYNLTIALFGGTTPVICAFLIEKTNMNFVPAFYLIIAVIIALIAALNIKETSHQKI